MLLPFIFVSLFSIITCDPVTESTEKNGTFYYFAYGSNLLAKRIHIKNPSAVFYSPAKLQNYRLDFVTYDEPWGGTAATIVEDNEEFVWGALWTLDVNQMRYLDEQEDVASNMYIPKNVVVSTPNGTEISARTYQETAVPTKIKRGEDLPFDRRPSSTYLGVITLGAIESQLPAEYIAYLFSIPANGHMASEIKRKELGYPF